MKRKAKSILHLKQWTFAVLVTTAVFSSCQKELKSPTNGAAETKKATIQLPVKSNPFSLRNVEKAKAVIKAGDQSEQSLSANQLGGNEKQFVYFKFNPLDLTTEQFQALENDSTVQLMEIPFGNMAIYSDEFALDEAKAEQLKDGSIYGVTPIENTAVFSSLSARPQTQTIYLDTLVQVADTDTTLQYQAFREAGATEETLNRFRICLFKKPHGYVNYWDTQLNRWERVRGMQVWSLFLGIPIYTYSDGNGYYEIPWRYSIGTIMGTKAKNARVNVKPLDTHGTLIRNLYTLITQFIVGSQHIEGWVTPCQMKDGKDFNFGGHTQVRYWSQILNAYYFHDQYSDNEGITKAPQSMVCYAQWANTKNFIDFQGVPSFGNASTPMLGHIPGSPASLLIQYFAGVFDGENITNYPNLFNMITGLLPDMTIRIPEAREPQFYNSRLTQIAMHELSHASHYNRVGNMWWLNFIVQTVTATPVSGNPYGDGSNWAYTEVGESWAEFLGTNFAMRRYPGRAGMKDATNNAPGIAAGRYYQMDNLIENEFWYFGGRWIPYGCYHDFMDNTNIAPNNPGENWDIIQGVSIQQLYNAHNSNVIDMCGYINSFTTQNPGLNQAAVFEIFTRHEAFCR